MICVRRVYSAPEPDEGARFLVDRLWPRGLKKEALQLDGWVREAAPSNALRKWFRHDPHKWLEFQQRYFAELDAHPEVWRPLIEAAQKGNLTLLYSAKDVQHNNAVALKSYLEERLKRSSRGTQFYQQKDTHED
ncbi:MAG: DUF488 domain-containing protein [bacterium]